DLVALTHIAGIDDAGPDALTFIRDGRYAARWAESRAGAAIVTRGLEADLEPGVARALLIVDDADMALVRLLEVITPAHVAPPPGAHATAVVDASVTLGDGVRLGPHVSIGPGSRIGNGAVLCAGVRIGAQVTIGAGCDLRAGVVIEDRCTLGDRVLIHPNAVIGADGFGYRPGPTGPVKIPHAGAVAIGDDVEIGAGTAIDRGKMSDTRIGAGTKIDNLVQIGHNCEIGRGCILCGQVALAGSVRVGDFATLGGGVGVRDNVRIGARAKVGARSGVMADIPDDGEWVGAPAAPYRDAMRSYAAVRSLPETLKRIDRALKSLGAPPDTP
ncbi:MAG: UDP-3-O-(3-hydroxymyristoyl)glucosamine N-acyltransferase, partial [Phycisphaerales bacterium]